MSVAITNRINVDSEYINWFDLIFLFLKVKKSDLEN